LAPVDAIELETKVKDLYRHVAEQPHGAYHFEAGRALAERLGYPADLLDRIPGEAIESFAGVGYFVDLADLRPGERVSRSLPHVSRPIHPPGRRTRRASAGPAVGSGRWNSMKVVTTASNERSRNGS
jgi:hypothetical protein